MQEALNAQRIYDFIRNDRESPRSIATLHPLLVLPLLVGRAASKYLYIPYLASFVALGVLKCCGLLAFGFYVSVIDDGCRQFPCLVGK